MTENLRQLTKKDTPWVWGNAHQVEFNYLRNTLSSNTVMCYYDPNKEHEIITDAGPAGITAILVQHSKTQEDHQIVAYSSRALNDVERRYSQMEKECLAILCEKFRVYVISAPFIIQTTYGLCNYSSTNLKLNTKG